MLKLVAEIDEFKGRWSAVRALSSTALDQLRQSSGLESAGASTRIEGISLSDEEIASFLSEPGPEGQLDPDKVGTAAYASTLKIACEESVLGPLTETQIRKFHRLLLPFSSQDSTPPGEYKRNANYIAEFDNAGRQIGILFETTGPMQTPDEMNRLMQWLGQAQEDGLHPLFITALFVFRFLAIHPFPDRNGKLSCILATALLLRFGYSYVPYASLEKMIEENRTGYYSSLRETERSLKWAAPEWEIWVEFFLDCLARQKRKLERKIEAEQAAPLDLSSLALTIVDLLELRPRVTVSSVVQATGASRHAVKSTLRRLVQHSLVVPKGRGRGSHYSFLR